ncbi:hypothetical protein ON010_g18924 [Phytophthora cinnamomi]|nr:hypothetical protein ON010_g18924 [Phytophthora cinnamomi]
MGRRALWRCCERVDTDEVSRPVAPPVEEQTKQVAHLLADYEAQLRRHSNHVHLERLGVGRAPLGHGSRPLVVDLARRHTPLNNPPQSLVTVGCFFGHKAESLQGALGPAVVGVVLLAKVFVAARQVRNEVGVARTGRLLPVSTTELAPMKRVALGLEE